MDIERLFQSYDAALEWLFQRIIEDLEVYDETKRYTILELDDGSYYVKQLR